MAPFPVTGPSTPWASPSPLTTCRCGPLSGCDLRYDHMFRMHGIPINSPCAVSMPVNYVWQLQIKVFTPVHRKGAARGDLHACMPAPEGGTATSHLYLELSRGTAPRWDQVSVDQLDQNKAVNKAGQVIGQFNPISDEVSEQRLQPYSEVPP